MRDIYHVNFLFRDNRLASPRKNCTRRVYILHFTLRNLPLLKRKLNRKLDKTRENPNHLASRIKLHNETRFPFFALWCPLKIHVESSLWAFDFNRFLIEPDWQINFSRTRAFSHANFRRFLTFWIPIDRNSLRIATFRVEFSRFHGGELY